MISNYVRKLILGYSIGSAAVGFVLALAITMPINQNIKRGAETDYLRLVGDYEALYDTFNRELDYSRELELTIVRMHEEYKLLATFLDSGFRVETPEEIRLLMEQAEDMPFGSPFSNGHRVTSQYGIRTLNEYGWIGVDHPGIDLVPLNGDYMVYLPAEATLIDFGVSDLWGKYMEFETQAGYRMFFAHLETIYWQDLDGDGNWSLTVGDILPARTRIALMGQTGKYATGAHLHYEIKVQVDGEWTTLDPEVIIGYTGAMSDDNEVQ